eukprot:CAMPEP_0171759550 /NCGR_PEP_ID=MMETSP0991-20121206/46964_1 /TAXON_ID=483369 /ORGANISM="non described non described, Strain CCMP2098" /LENGTH=353 /DNA_ID=CAMNT_0012362517 /DNA_START=114 /DNA_END=1175 /DNA_ORIENTATION=+
MSIGKSMDPSLGAHPFIMEPNKWVGTPWSEGGAAALGPEADADEEMRNARLVAEFHARLAEGTNVADLFNESKRTSKLASAGRAPVFPGAKKKLSVASKPSAVDSGAPTDAADVNPFVVELVSRQLPLQVVDKRLLTYAQVVKLKAKKTTVPIAWTLPRGFGVKNLDGGHYLPLFCHGLRALGEDLGAPMGDVALEALRALLSCHGPAGRVFRNVKALILPLRQALSFASTEDASPSGCDQETCVAVGTRVLKALQLLVHCDDASPDPLVRGSVATQLFSATKGGGNPAFTLIATPLATLRSRVVGSREFLRKEPKLVQMGELMFATLTLLELRGGAPAKRAIASAFPSGIAC